MAELDTNLYSRQIGVFGFEAMGKLVKLDVLLVGMKGLGVEIAKNLILAGPRSVTLFDTEASTLADTGSNYYLTPATVGTPRAAACVDSLAELNPYVKVSVLHEPTITDAVLSRFSVVVATNASRADQIKWNTFCHANNIPFIASDVLGAAGYVFSDFGSKHVVRDTNGENNRSAVVASILIGEKTIVHCHDNKRHGFDDGDSVVFREVEGMAVLNDGVPRRITNCKAHSFELEGVDSRGWPEHAGGGMVEQIKVPVTMTFESLATRVSHPAPAEKAAMGLDNPDYGKWGRSEQLHVAFQAIELYREKYNALPKLRDADAATECVGLAREWVASLKGKANALAMELEAVDAAVVTHLASVCRAELPALCAFFGGIVAQEVVKVTGKYTPIHQWLYLDSFEVLGQATAATAASDEFTPRGDRYDYVVSMIGRTMQAKIMDQRVFVVGAGALGCEFLKNFALMGVGCGPNGSVTVTDMDRIEISNLNRQFLFRAPNIGQPKSVTAAAAARHMNPSLKVEALEIPVGEDTETTFNDAFWSKLDFVTNALDNVKARQYVDGRCVFYGKPLMESGTLGTKANTQVVLPHLTESYSDSQDPPDESIPMCTLRNFPHAIEHCIEWARDLFQGSFNNSVQEAAAYIANPAAWLEKLLEEQNMAVRRAKLEGAAKCLEAAKGASFDVCVEIAFSQFSQHFYLKICQLLHNFPQDYVDSNGVKFWTGVKRAPTPAEFTASDPLHWAFLMNSTALIAGNFGVKLPEKWDSPEVLGAAVAKLPPAVFTPKSVRIKAGDADTTEEGADDDKHICETLISKLSALSAAASSSSVGAGGGSSSGASTSSYNLTPAEFEKDDDTNHHIAFITAASNLRARNYKIKETTLFEVKMIAGKIIPAIATTTCSITGLVCVEMYKHIAGCKLEAMRNSFMNLAVNVYSMGEPIGPKKMKSVENDPILMGPVRAYPEGWTRWDKFVVRGGNLTCKELVDWFSKEHKLSLSMITAGKSILYNPLLFAAHREKRSNMKVLDLWMQVTNSSVPAGRDYLMLDVSVNDETTFDDVIIPQVQFVFA